MVECRLEESEGLTLLVDSSACHFGSGGVWATGTLAAGALAAVSPAFSAPADEAYDQSYARLSFVSGDISVERASNLGEEAGEVSVALGVGARGERRPPRRRPQVGRRQRVGAV